MENIFLLLLIDRQSSLAYKGDMERRVQAMIEVPSRNKGVLTLSLERVDGKNFLRVESRPRERRIENVRVGQYQQLTLFGDRKNEL